MESRKKNAAGTEVKPTDKDQLYVQQVNLAMISHAKQIAQEIKAKAILAYVDVFRTREPLKEMITEHLYILAVRTAEIAHKIHEKGVPTDRILQVPYMNMTRASQIKVAVMLALSRKLLRRDQKIVCLSGILGSGTYDTLSILDVSREFEIFSALELDIAAQIEKPHVFDRLLTVALELAQEGREGKPLGATFILGDHNKVMEMSSQMVINPFAGVPDEQRNIMDSRLKETLREFCTMDGAFVVRDDGVVLAAARHLKVSAEISGLPQGLGARHRSAAGITALTKAVAVVISESTGAVRIFSRGRMFMEIEKRS